MTRAVLEACLPWFACLTAAAVVAWLLLRANRSRLRLGRLRMIHRNEYGGVQSLAFVLTLPIFMMVMALIVQVSQLMIATVTVHYAAYAAARSASVWIPADMGFEAPNCISIRYPDPNAPNQVFPETDPQSPNYGPRDGGVTYIVESDPESPKWRKIHLAAAMACMTISPSRDVGVGVGDTAVLEPLHAAYASMVSSSASNVMIGPRLGNKLAYALEATEVELWFFHQNREPPLSPPPMMASYGLPPDPTEFRPGELGWQDMVTVTVHHQLSLLPGPGRILAKYVPGARGSRIDRLGNTYVYPLRATAVMCIEGEKPLVTYRHGPHGEPWQSN